MRCCFRRSTLKVSNIFLFKRLPTGQEAQKGIQRSLKYLLQLSQIVSHFVIGEEIVE